MRGKAHSESDKVKAIAALIAGQTVLEVATAHGLPESTVQTWKNDVPDAQFALVRAKKGEEIETLLYEYLKTLVNSLRSQAEIAGERAYIERQPAGELYLLHGTMADKGFKLLEAAARAKTFNAASTPATD